jgi:hypothetical protein
MGMNVPIVRAEFGGWWVVGDVAKLVAVVVEIADAMLVIAGVPDFFLR